MSVASASTLVEVPSITSAVEHLQDLGLRMQSEEYGFSEQDISTIDTIIEAIDELYNEGKKTHEKLETETIKSSVLRHTLQFLPGIVQKEIQDAVKSARQSNADLLQKLQNHLQKVNDNMEFLKEKRKRLETENSVLQPERDSAWELHEHIITELNQWMAQKASKQIILNETRDTLRDTNHKIVDLEEGILQLKEDLIQERADARMEKKRLKKEVYDTSMQTRDQNEVNDAKKKELDSLLHQVYGTETQLEEVRKSIKKFEGSKSRLETQEQLLLLKLERETRQNDSLHKKGCELEESLKEQEETFVNLKSQLENEFEELKNEIKRQEENKIQWTNEKRQLGKGLVEKIEIRKEDKERVSKQNAKLQARKLELAKLAGDAARLRQENADMEVRKQQLNESHEAITSTVQKQIIEMREQLNKERKERVDLQNERDSMQKNVDDFKLESHKYLSKKNKEINEGKQEHDRLTHEGTQLQNQIREAELNIRQLQDHIKTTKADLQVFTEKREREVTILEEEIAILETNLNNTRSIINERTPTFVALEQYHETRTAEYDKMKKHVVSLKNRKLDLEDSIKRTDKNIQSLIQPTDKLREDLKESRHDAMQQLKMQAAERTEIEKQIYVTGAKLKTALEENQHFIKENEKFEQNMNGLDQEIIDSTDIIAKLEVQIEEIKVQLMKEWSADNEIQEMFAIRDQALVEEMGRLLERTTKREDVIGEITTKLDSELVVLGEFLNNVAKRRPKDSAKPNRISCPKSPKLSRQPTLIDVRPKAPKAETKDSALLTNVIAAVAEANNGAPQDDDGVTTPSNLTIEIKSPPTARKLPPVRKPAKPSSKK